MRKSLKYTFFNFLRKLGLGFDPMKSPEVQKMIEASKKDGKDGFELKFEVFADGEWLVTSEELPGLITGGSLKEFNNIEEQVIDAIFTYFAVPPQYCDSRLFLGAKEYKHKATLPLKLTAVNSRYEPA